MGDFAEREAKRARRAEAEAEARRKREAAQALLERTGSGPCASEAGGQGRAASLVALLATKGDNTLEMLKEKAAARPADASAPAATKPAAEPRQSAARNLPSGWEVLAEAGYFRHLSSGCATVMFPPAVQGGKWEHASAIPPGWKRIDAGSQSFYWHAASNVSQWAMPAEETAFKYHHSALATTKTHVPLPINMVPLAAENQRAKQGESGSGGDKKDDDSAPPLSLKLAAPLVLHSSAATSVTKRPPPPSLFSR